MNAAPAPAAEDAWSVGGGGEEYGTNPPFQPGETKTVMAEREEEYLGSAAPPPASQSLRKNEQRGSSSSSKSKSNDNNSTGAAFGGDAKTAEEKKSTLSSPARRASRVPSPASSTADLLHPTFPPRRRLRIYPGGNHTSKWVTREIAALEFLTGVRMRNEPAIRARGGSSGGGDGSVSAREDADLLLPRAGKTRSRREQQQQGGSDWGSPEGDVTNAGIGGDAGRAAAGDFAHRGGDEAGVVGGTAINDPDANDDSDSDGGWLDQPTDGGVDGGRPVRLSGTPSRGSTGGAAGMISGVGSPAPARRLRGREAAHVRVPPTFRHSMQSVAGHNAAVVRQWEQRLTRQDRLLEGRMFFSCSKGYPIMVSSVIHYKPQEEEARRVRQKWIDERGAEAFQIEKRDWRGYSYAYLLRPLHSGGSGLGSITELGSEVAGPAGSAAGVAGLENSDGEGGGGSAVGDAGGRAVDTGGDVPYVAGFLDDPALKVGKHRHVTRGDKNTGPVVSSVLLFVKPRVLKDELNARFREEHPSLPPSLTLSKIRSVKRQALLGCHRAGMEVATVALACIYFERLCLAGLVTKPNRRLAMAACLAIAYKFNEPVLMEGASKLPALWAFVDQEWQVSKKRVLEAELGVLVKLTFNLHEDPRDIFYHFVLLLKMLESNATLYLGEEMMTLHQESLETFRDGDSDEAPRAGSGGVDGGAESPRTRVASDAGTLGGDNGPRAVSSRGSAFMEAPGWLQRRPTNGSRWLAGWRGSPEENAASESARSGSARRSGRGSTGSIASGIARLRQAGHGLGKETRQRRQKLSKNVKSSASFLVGSSSHRRSRRRMEA